MLNISRTRGTFAGRRGFRKSIYAQTKQTINRNNKNIAFRVSDAFDVPFIIARIFYDHVTNRREFNVFILLDLTSCRNVPKYDYIVFKRSRRVIRFVMFGKTGVKRNRHAREAYTANIAS